MADLALADGEFALPFAIGRIVVGKRLFYAEALLVRVERLDALALPCQHVGDLIVAEGQVQLPLRIGWIAVWSFWAIVRFFWYASIAAVLFP